MKRFKKNIIGFLLLSIAVFLILPLTVWNRRVVRKNRGNTDGYYLNTAVNLDIWANREFRALWNAKLRKMSGYNFGHIGETISSALGKNQRDKTLSFTGRCLAKILDTIDKDHCKKSIKEF